MEQKMQKKQPDKVVSVELSSVKVQQLSRQPIIESSISLSEDKRWVIHRTIITDIKPFSYYEKVLD